MKIVDLGCGQRKYFSENKKDVVIGVDFYDDSKLVDVKHDLDKYPYPFKANEFDLVYSSHVIEHVADPFRFVDEIYRIAKPGAKVIIKAPHFSYAFAHAQHKNAVGIGYFETMGVTDKNAWTEKRTGAKFKLLKRKFTYMLGKSGKLTWPIFALLNLVLNFFANLNPFLCERIWCYWFGGFEEIYFELEVIK
ncbi:MAG: class I SAM-dependent methyltransferase [Candidatus ainarchaeum sp.]|nr:class I SAM-dependent methyltransferase [Candidatus ainarchaeum sp.]